MILTGPYRTYDLALSVLNGFRRMNVVSFFKLLLIQISRTVGPMVNRRIIQIHLELHLEGYVTPRLLREHHTVLSPCFLPTESFYGSRVFFVQGRRR